MVKVIETTAFEYNQGSRETTVAALIEGASKKDATKLQGKSPWNQTVLCPLPAGARIDDFVGKVVDVRVDTARTWYLSGEMVGGPR